MTVDELNALSEEAAIKCFLKCCHSQSWAKQMVAGRPYSSQEEMLAAAQAPQMSEKDWLEAFSAHPLIGDIESLKKKYSATREWSTGEQVSVSEANDDVLSELAELNKEYFEKHGFIFIVCATGKSAQEMLTLLKDRIYNSRNEEILNASREQIKISKLRMEKL